ncbi:MAG: response regulator [Bacteroidota bacterium]
MKKEKLQILVADDDPDYLFQMRLHLESWGYQVITTESQKETERVIAGLKPDLAIFDLMMEQDDSGFILAYRFKQRYPDVPVIISTAVAAETGISFGLNSQEDRNWIKADLYLEKGVQPARLHQEIENLLNRKWNG